MGVQVEIFFDDLSEDKQRELLEAANAKDRDDMNWGVFPVAVVEYEPEEDEDNEGSEEGEEKETPPTD